MYFLHTAKGSRLEIVLLPACPRVLVQVPLHIRVLILKGAHGNGKWPEGEARPNLAEFHTVIAGPDVYMVSYLDAIVLVNKRDHSVALVLLD